MCIIMHVVINVCCNKYNNLLNYHTTYLEGRDSKSSSCKRNLQHNTKTLYTTNKPLSSFKLCYPLLNTYTLSTLSPSPLFTTITSQLHIFKSTFTLHNTQTPTSTHIHTQVHIYNSSLSLPLPCESITFHFLHLHPQRPAMHFDKKGHM
jgi:hypothetical protein